MEAKKESKLVQIKLAITHICFSLCDILFVCRRKEGGEKRSDVRREEVMEVKEEWLYLDSGPVRRWRAAAPGRRPPPETPCASSSAPAAQKRINEAASRTEAPVRTGRLAESRKPTPLPPLI